MLKVGKLSRELYSQRIMLLHAADSDLFQAMFEVAIDYQGHYQTGMRTGPLLGYIM